MPTYRYRCPVCGDMDIKHPMNAVDDRHRCPECGAFVHRVLTPVTHRWPSNHFPGNEDSGQRMFLDPDFQAETRERLAREKEEHLKREAAENG